MPQPEPAPAEAPPTPALSRLAKAELYRRAQGRCVRCDARLNLATAQFRVMQAVGAQGAPGAADWEVICPSCLERAASAMAS